MTNISLKNLISEGSEHEWRPPLVVCFVHPKHHDEVPNHSRVFTHGHRHVQWVRVVLRAERK